ncbi:hypothetical protein BKA61DRAFT_636754 [Leptodontidium sp. MPI-SDFR-AT-0119]|nr:hypothetical protein BKA61DRAFT_636754 [Leptodontidium sp. MPI-SDFR-AT-0119]
MDDLCFISITTAFQPPRLNYSSSLRPVLHHLNADTSWLLSLPYPPSSPAPKNRAYCHILIDPWFPGPQSDRCADGRGELEEVAKKIEEAARPTNTAEPFEESDDSAEDEKESYVDAIIISHEFTNHMHQETLLSLPASISTHFTSVADLSRFTGNWRESWIPQLPGWIGTSRVAYPGKDLLYYYSAVPVCFCDGNENEEAEAVLYTPHGVPPANVEPLSRASPKIRILALPAWKMIAIKETVGRQKEKFGNTLDEVLGGLRDVRFEEVDNGGSLVLE